MTHAGAYRHAHDEVHWFMNELSSRVVAESGIPSDRDHLGKLILRSLKDAPDFVMQVCSMSKLNFFLQPQICIFIMIYILSL